MEEPVRQVACAYCTRRRRRRRRRRLARRAKELLFNSDPDEEVNRMGSMDANVEDKRSQILPIKIKINLAKKQVMDEYWEEAEEVKGLEKDSRPMCPHPQVSPPTPTNCVKDEYGEKAEEVIKAREKLLSPTPAPSSPQIPSQIVWKMSSTNPLKGIAFIKLYFLKLKLNLSIFRLIYTVQASHAHRTASKSQPIKPPEN